MRIVLTTWGSLGDLHPYLALGTEMKRRGHEVAVGTLGVWESSVRDAGLGFHPVRPDVPRDDPGSKELVRKLLNARGGPDYLIEKVLAPVLRETYEDCLAAVRADGGADLLITHQVPITGPLVAQATGVEWVSGVLLPMAFLSDYDPATPPQAPWIQKVAALHPAIAGLLHKGARRMTRKWAEPVDRLRESLGLPPGGHPVFEGQHSPALVLALFSRVLTEKQPDFPPQTVITGFPFYDAADERPPEPELLQFLDAGEPPIVFTLGSSAVWIADDFYTTAIEVVRTLGRRAVLLAGDEAAGLRASGLPDTIAAFGYAPHSLVMPRGSAIVHQGGVGTTGQALRSSRPQLVVPFGQDQPDNARRCVRLGVARTIARSAFRRDRVASELEQLLGNGDYARRAGEVAAIVRSEEGTKTACDEVERRIHATLSPWKTSKPPSATSSWRPTS
jgi:UDP:flavonoid glycosyltransferase YjiC (YdhE family)